MPGSDSEPYFRLTHISFSFINFMYLRTHSLTVQNEVLLFLFDLHSFIIFPLSDFVFFCLLFCFVLAFTFGADDSLAVKGVTPWSEGCMLD